MSIRIYREGGKFELIPERLAYQLRILGVVAFTSGRVRQRQVANQVIESVKANLMCLHAETSNGVMCIVDTARYAIFEILREVSKLEDEFERKLC